MFFRAWLRLLGAVPGCSWESSGDGAGRGSLGSCSPAQPCPAVRKPHQQLPCLCCERGAPARGEGQYFFTELTHILAHTPELRHSENVGANGNKFVSEKKVDLSIVLPPIVMANNCFQGQCLLVFSNRNNIINT